MGTSKMKRHEVLAAYWWPVFARYSLVARRRAVPRHLVMRHVRWWSNVVSLHADLMPYYVQMMSCPFCVNVNPLTVYLPGAWDLCSLTVMHFPSENLYVLTGVLGPQNSCLTKIKKVRSLISLFCNPARRDPGILPSFMLIVTAYHLLVFRPH